MHFALCANFSLARQQQRQCEMLTCGALVRRVSVSTNLPITCAVFLCAFNLGFCPQLKSSIIPSPILLPLCFCDVLARLCSCAESSVLFSRATANMKAPPQCCRRCLFLWTSRFRRLVRARADRGRTRGEATGTHASRAQSPPPLSSFLRARVSPTEAPLCQRRRKGSGCATVEIQSSLGEINCCSRATALLHFAAGSREKERGERERELMSAASLCARV